MFFFSSYVNYKFLRLFCVWIVFCPDNLDSTCRCRFMNFARNTSCKRCQEPRSVTRMGPGDWKCPVWVSLLCVLLISSSSTAPRYNFHTFNTHLTRIFSCPESDLCRCDFVNFSRNMSCLKCKKGGPKDAERTASPYDTSLGSEDDVERNL